LLWAIALRLKLGIHLEIDAAEHRDRERRATMTAPWPRMSATVRRSSVCASARPIAGLRTSMSGHAARRVADVEHRHASQMNALMW